MEFEEKPKESYRQANILTKIFIVCCIVFVVAISIGYLLFFPARISLKDVYANPQRFNNSKIKVEGIVFRKSLPFPEQGNPLYLESDGFIIDVRNTSRLYNEGEKIEVEGIVRVVEIIFLESLKEEYIGLETFNKKEKYLSISLDKLKEPKKLLGRLIRIENLTLESFNILPREVKVFNETYFGYQLTFRGNLRGFYLGPPMQIEKNKSYEVFAAFLYSSDIPGYLLRVFELNLYK